MRILLVLGVLAAMSVAAGAQEIAVPAPPGALHGTLLKAGDHAPAVLIIAGSGPTDRDGNSTLNVRASTYRLLAEGLAASGVASLRYDKRGVGESKAALTSETDLRIQTYADDAAAMAAALRRQTGAKCVWVLGHSEGALLAEIMAQHAEGICGLVLVSGSGRKAADLLRTQMQTALPPQMQPAALSTLSELEQGRIVLNPPQAAAVLFRESVQPYMISWFRQDPVALLATIRLPVLILQGDNDLQISVADAKLLAAAKPDATLAILPGVNHLLKAAPADRAGNMATYADPSLPLAPGVVDRIAAFVHEHSR